MIYFLVSSLEEYNDAYGFHNQYFVEEKGFLFAFLIALFVAVVIAAFFYLFICNVFNRLSKFYVWVIALFLTVGATLLLTSKVIVGGEDENTGDYTGFYYSLEDHAGNKREEFAQNQEAQKMVNQEYDQIMQDLAGSGEEEYKVIDMLYLTNTILTIFFFILISMLIKGTTKYGIAIPCVWPRKLHF